MASVTTKPQMSAVLFGAFVLMVSIVSFGECQTTPPPSPCSSFTTCDTCVPHAKCLWCFSTNNCTEYPVRWLLPPASVCKLSEARWGVCWLNFEALIITFGVLGGVIILAITVCCCYCCYCRKSSPRVDREDEQYARRREEIRQRSEERKVDRKTRHDEIRRKYGTYPS